MTASRVHSGNKVEQGLDGKGKPFGLWNPKPDEEEQIEMGQVARMGRAAENERGLRGRVGCPTAMFPSSTAPGTRKGSPTLSLPKVHREVPLCLLLSAHTHLCHKWA